MANSSCTISFYDLNCTGPSLSVRDRAIVLTLVALVNATTVAGNLLLIATVSFFRRLRSWPNVMALSLAVSDLLVGTLVMPLATVKAVYSCWFYADLLCHWHFFLDFALTTCSILHVACIAYDRYVAVCDPLRYATRVTERTVGAMLALCWLGAALVSAPILFSLSPALSPNTIHRILCPDDCFFYVHGLIIFVIQMGPYIVSVAFVVALYGQIYRAARLQARRIGGVGGGGGGKSSSAEATAAARSEHKATKQLGIIIGCFLLSCLPFYLVDVVSLVDEALFVPFRITVLSGYISSALNPLLFAKFNRQLRAGFAMVLRAQLFRPGARDTDFSGGGRRGE
ncbi:trace amine-associated receptor 365-like [Lampetra fluviatilis]